MLLNVKKIMKGDFFLKFLTIYFLLSQKAFRSLDFLKFS